MFDFFKGKRDPHWTENKIYDDVQPPTIPEVVPPTKSLADRECYRVGFDTSAGMVTLTFLGERGAVMTLAMNDPEVGYLIKMLESARRPDFVIAKPQAQEV